VRTRHALFVVCVVVLWWVGPAAAQSGQTTGTVTGTVLDQSGGARQGVAVRLSPILSGDPRIVITSSAGIYTFAGVPAATYRIEIVGDHYLPSASVITVSGETTTHHLVSGPPPIATLTLVLVTIILFAAGVLAYRHHNIVHTTRKMLLAQLENIETRLPLESNTTPETAASIDTLAKRVAAIKNGVPKHLGWQEWFFWSRGHEISGWISLHEVERQLIAFLVPESRVLERAAMAEAELRALNKPNSLVLADRLRITMQQVSAAPVDAAHIAPHLLEHLKQQLAEALTILYREDDTRFATLMEWHNKAMWLVYLSLLSIIVLGVVFHHEELFVVGAVGGLLSRMTRSLFREDVPSDYGASWTTLFLSPLLGAISAWAGIAVLAWLRDVEALGAQFDKMAWDHPSTVWVIALGITLGFSERFFTSLLSKVEGRVTDELERRPPPPLPPLPTPASATAPAATQGAPQAGQPDAAGGVSAVDRIVAELDVQPGERAAFFGDPASSTRRKLVGIAGAPAVVDVTADTFAALGPFDAVLFDSPPTIDQLTAAAPHLMTVLRPDGRVVVVGRSTAALFDADAATQKASAHLGPSLVHALLTGAGLSPQEPPAPLAEGDTTDWVASFVKPAAVGGDR
jgi:hypothetical protein